MTGSIVRKKYALTSTALSMEAPANHPGSTSPPPIHGSSSSADDTLHCGSQPRRGNDLGRHTPSRCTGPLGRRLRSRKTSPLHRASRASTSVRRRGKKTRQATAPSAHACWKPAEDRPDPVALLEEQNATREPDLVRSRAMALGPKWPARPTLTGRGQRTWPPTWSTPPARVWRFSSAAICRELSTSARPPRRSASCCST